MRRDAARRRLRRLAGVGTLALALPLAACATPASAAAPDLLRAGCPADLRIATDALPGVEWGFLYGLLAPDRVAVRGDAVTGPLVVDGERTGVTLTILTGDPLDGAPANVALYEDEDILLAAVDTDVALLDAVRYPTVGVFAPLARNPRMLFWDARAYPGLRNIEDLGRTRTPDAAGPAPVALPPADPFAAYLRGKGWLIEDQQVAEPELTIAAFLEAGGWRVQSGSALTGPLLERAVTTPLPTRSQLLDDVAYTVDAGVLSARPQALVRYADCLHALVPLLQRALADYLADPEPANELLVELSAALGHPELDAELAAAAFRVLTRDGFAGAGRDGTLGDIDLGRVRGLFETAIPEWRGAEVPVPAVDPDDIVTNRFIDRAIGD